MHTNYKLKTYITVFLLKIRHENDIALASLNYYRLIDIQYSTCVHILFPFIACTCDDLC